jgi:hypothetical protein
MISSDISPPFWKNYSMAGKTKSQGIQLPKLPFSNLYIPIVTLLLPDSVKISYNFLEDAAKFIEGRNRQ